MSDSEWDVHITYEIQDEAGGIAQALELAEGFADEENVFVILGDNIFQDSISEDVSGFKSGSKIFLKEVPDANRFGVAELDGDRVRVLPVLCIIRARVWAGTVCLLILIILLMSLKKLMKL